MAGAALTMVVVALEIGFVGHGVLVAGEVVVVVEAVLRYGPQGVVTLRLAAVVAGGWGGMTFLP